MDEITCVQFDVEQILSMKNETLSLENLKYQWRNHD